jgi:hypothetical protein
MKNTDKKTDTPIASPNFSVGLCLPLEERKPKDNCAKEDCFFYSGAIRTHCKLRDEHRRMCGKYIPFTAHNGDPCQYCGKPHDEIKRGPCPKRVKQR